MAKKAKKKEVKKAVTHRKATSGGIFESHPNLKMLLYMFILSIILWMLTYQL